LGVGGRGDAEQGEEHGFHSAHSSGTMNKQQAWSAVQDSPFHQPDILV
jgi:hypothetical protein